MTPAALVSLATHTASTLPPSAGQGLLEVGRGLVAVPDSRRLSGRLDSGCLHDVDGAVVEHGCVSVGGVTAHVDDDGGGRVLAGSGEAVEDRLALELADLEVVERHVVVRAFDRAVVRDDRDALGLGLLGDSGTCAVVVDEQHDAAALAELLVGDGGVLVGVTLGVLDVRPRSRRPRGPPGGTDGRCSPSAATMRRRAGSRKHVSLRRHPLRLPWDRNNLRATAPRLRRLQRQRSMKVTSQLSPSW